jgi:hypothetical protein
MTELEQAKAEIDRLRTVLYAVWKEAFYATSSPTVRLLAERVREIEKMAKDALEHL